MENEKNVKSQGHSESGSLVCYAVILEDRHIDTNVYLFIDKDKAIEWARATAKKYDEFGDYKEELTASMAVEGWLFYATYTCENDCVRVVKRTVDMTT
jgi:hypothetical protein